MQPDGGREGVEGGVVVEMRLAIDRLAPAREPVRQAIAEPVAAVSDHAADIDREDIEFELAVPSVVVEGEIEDEPGRAAFRKGARRRVLKHLIAQPANDRDGYGFRLVHSLCTARSVTFWPARVNGDVQFYPGWAARIESSISSTTSDDVRCGR